MFGIILVTALALSAPASAQPVKCWTSVASAGTVDEADLAQFTTSLRTLAVKDSVTSAQVVARYNVVALDRLFGGPVNLLVRHTDNGASARVLVRLRSVNLFNGVGATLAEFDSDNYPQRASPQFINLTVIECDTPGFDFFTFAYWLEVTLIKTGVAGTPAIHALQLCNFHGC